MRAPRLSAGALGLGVATLWLSIIVLLPLAAVVDRSLEGGLAAFWESVSSRQAVAALRFTLLISLGVAAINAVMGTLIAWVLVRDDFRGKSFVNALIDLPFALPTIVAGLTLLALYGEAIAFTKWAVLLALLFVTLPFVVRAVQPVLIELDREMEEAAASLGASQLDDLPPHRASRTSCRRSSPASRWRSRGRSASSARSCSSAATSRSTRRSRRSTPTSRSSPTTSAARPRCRSCCSRCRCSVLVGAAAVRALGDAA